MATSVIEDYAKEIENVVEAKEVTAHLLSQGIIDIHERNDIDEQKTRREGTKRLIEVLISKGKRSFPEFVRSLKSNGYNELATKLNNEGEEQAQPNRTDSSSSRRLQGEQTLAEKFDDLKEMINTDVKGSLREIKELVQSRIDKDTDMTITNLRQQLEEKDKQLANALERNNELEKELEEYKLKRMAVIISHKNDNHNMSQ